jgi:phosphoribosylformylglycinamidine cyclo-ligase
MWPYNSPVDTLCRTRYIGGMPKSKSDQKLSYARAGVDIKAGDQAVERIKQLAAATFNKQVLTGLGAFGGFFEPDMKSLKEPVLISSTDSVGTKVKLAFMTNKHDTVGEDLVNHCVNDILVHGARPLFFLDYIGIGTLKPDVVAEIAEGLSRGCKNAGAALIGGETAELRDFYQPGEYDLVGFVVGVVDKAKIINGSTIKDGDVCIGLTSNGLHTNGYTLARKVAFEVAGLKPDDYMEELGDTIAESLMRVHRCYGPLIHPLLEKHEIHGMAHITGGGIEGNLKRILPDSLQAEIDASVWPVPRIFEYLRTAGDLDTHDMYSAFNMGIGYILVVPERTSAGVLSNLQAMGEKAYHIGRITSGAKSVKLINKQ